MNNQSFRPEREFGLIVGGAFLLLATWWWYRGKYEIAVDVLFLIGTLLLLLGLIAPRALRHPRRAWMFLAEILGYISTRIILALVFFLVVTPIGVAKRLFGWDPLGRRGAATESYWKPYSDRQRNPKHYEKMF